MIDYKKYVGQFVKRFYTPFLEGNIFEIRKFRDTGTTPDNLGEFLYGKGDEQWWSDVDDSVIITNELAIIEDERVANINDKDYKGFNPYNKNSNEK